MKKYVEVEAGLSVPAKAAWWVVAVVAAAVVAVEPTAAGEVAGAILSGIVTVSEAIASFLAALAT